MDARRHEDSPTDSDFRISNISCTESVCTSTSDSFVEILNEINGIPAKVHDLIQQQSLELEQVYQKKLEGIRSRLVDLRTQVHDAEALAAADTRVKMLSADLNSVKLEIAHLNEECVKYNEEIARNKVIVRGCRESRPDLEGKIRSLKQQIMVLKSILSDGNDPGGSEEKAPPKKPSTIRISNIGEVQSLEASPTELGQEIKTIKAGIQLMQSKISNISRFDSPVVEYVRLKEKVVELLSGSEWTRERINGMLLVLDN